MNINKKDFVKIYLNNHLDNSLIDLIIAKIPPITPMTKINLLNHFFLVEIVVLKYTSYAIIGNIN